jgi:hypothetical protein
LRRRRVSRSKDRVLSKIDASPYRPAQAWKLIRIIRPVRRRLDAARGIGIAAPRCRYSANPMATLIFYSLFTRPAADRRQ